MSRISPQCLVKDDGLHFYHLSEKQMDRLEWLEVNTRGDDDGKLFWREHWAAPWRRLNGKNYEAEYEHLNAALDGAFPDNLYKTVSVP